MVVLKLNEIWDGESKTNNSCLFSLKGVGRLEIWNEFLIAQCKNIRAWHCLNLYT